MNLRINVRPNTNLDDAIPTARDDDRVGDIRGESDTADPLGVVVFSDGDLALTEGVPQLDGSVAGSRDDLSVVRGESNREDILLVSNESLGGSTGLQVPETEGTV